MGSRFSVVTSLYFVPEGNDRQMVLALVFSVVTVDRENMVSFVLYFDL